MEEQSARRLTLYLEPDLEKALKVRAIEERRRTNSLVVDAIRRYLEGSTPAADDAAIAVPAAPPDQPAITGTVLPEFVTRREYEALKKMVGPDAIENSIGILSFAIEQRRVPLTRDEAANLLLRWNEQKLPHRRAALEIDEVLDRALSERVLYRDERDQIWSAATFERDWYEANEGMRLSLASTLKKTMMTPSE